jgi:hypothetical protein
MDMVREPSALPSRDATMEEISPSSFGGRNINGWVPRLAQLQEND